MINFIIGYILGVLTVLGIGAYVSSNVDMDDINKYRDRFKKHE